jgi:hypothetical protein
MVVSGSWFSLQQQRILMPDMAIILSIPTAHMKRISQDRKWAKLAEKSPGIILQGRPIDGCHF